MKIGIISINMYSKGLNFACPLHNYAFQQFLKKNGIDSTVISYKPIYFNDFDLRHPADYYDKLCERFEKSGRDKTEPDEWKRITGLRESWRELYDERERRYDKFQNFIDTHYIKTEECYDSDLLEVEDPGFDCYICCTDVIWKKEPRVGFDRGFFLASTAMENKWKISYAASRGVHFSENKEDEELFLRYVNDIDMISVREESLKDYLKENLEKEVAQVLDPVMLHEKEFYDSILVKPEEEQYLFLYYVMERAADTIDRAVEYARLHNLKIVEITERPLKNGRTSEYEGVETIYNYDMGMEEWLGYIKYADCVFTNSFHCCCFSIIFQKKFYVGARNGDKVTNVLRMFDLVDRKLENHADLSPESETDIDYKAVNRILTEKREKSADFILSALQKAEKTERPKKDYLEYKKSITYPVWYNSQKKDADIRHKYKEELGKTQKLNSGSYEFSPSQIKVCNDGNGQLMKNEFHIPGYRFAGWYLRIKIDRKWFYVLEDGTLKEKSKYRQGEDKKKYVLRDQDKIPFLPVNKITLAVAEAVWEKTLVKKIKDKICRILKKNGK